MIPEDCIGPGILRAVNDDCEASLGVFGSSQKNRKEEEKLAGRSQQMLWEWRREKTSLPCASLRLDSSSHSFLIVVFLWFTAFRWRHIFTQQMIAAALQSSCKHVSAAASSPKAELMEGNVETSQLLRATSVGLTELLREICFKLSYQPWH